MAEGLLGEFLGEEAEAGAAAEAAADARADGIAIGLAMDQARIDPEIAAKTSAFLEQQTQLVQMQASAFTEEQALRVSHLRSQSRESALRRIGHRIRIGTQLFTAFLIGAVGVGLVVMLYDAFHSKSVIVEPFDSPPSLAARGLTDKVVAGAVLDTLTQLQASTRSSSTTRNLSTAWTGDIKVEVPETGVSIGDIDRMLKARFGHDVHISGDLVQTGTGGLALTVRGDGVLPKTFEGGPGDLDKLTTQAAEYIYGQAEPSLYATYLSNKGRSAEAIAFSKAAFATTKPSDRPYLLNSWAVAIQNVGGDSQEPLALFKEARTLKPDFWVAYNNIMNTELLYGDEEAAWREGQALLQIAGGRPGRAPEVLYENLDLLTWNLQAWRAATLADEAAHAGAGTGVSAEAPAVADIAARLHDPTDAELQLQTAEADPNDPSIGAVTHFVHGRLAAEAGDAQTAAVEMEAFGAAFANPIVSSNYPGYNCWIAPAEEAAGHPDKADAALKVGGHFVDCYRFRGDILDHRGDWTGARQAYAQSVAMAPDLPAGDYSWGLALARHGDLDGAVVKFAAANLHGPHWADPLKAWGDVLARQGRWSEALVKYDAALKYAPAWSQLHQARDAAARRV
jgi:tetratricopeptide (TPR) repeat protein